jgi:hypothetical protein
VKAKKHYRLPFKGIINIKIRVRMRGTQEG